jgi:hypothetical protein
MIDWPKSWTRRCWHSNCCPRPRRLVAGALVLIKDRTAATNSRRGLLIAAGCVSAAFFGSFDDTIPPAR